MPVPDSPKIYHILHWDKLSSIVSDDCLLSGTIMAGRPVIGTTIGMPSMKDDRKLLPVHCHSGTHVADYVPFYFCPRSVMLYVIAKGNHPNLLYRGGQGPIVHLESDLYSVMDWADANEHRWAFSLSNATARYTQFRDRREQLGEINWTAVAANDWRPSEIKEAKQAEFLAYNFFPWHLVSRIGVLSQQIGYQVVRAIRLASHKPRVEVIQPWYY